VEQLQIIEKLTAVIQENVKTHFGHSRPTARGLETVRKYAQEQLDVFLNEMIKESPRLQKEWRLGHPLLILTRVNPSTKSYKITITTKDNPKGL
jgi:hypothetical protein